MSVDVASLLHELGVKISEGSSPTSWLLQTADGAVFDREPSTPVERLNALQLRIDTARRSDVQRPVLHVGDTATPQVIERAISGEIDILTADPVRLIHAGRIYEAPPAHPAREPAHRTGKPAWIRWALQRYLLLTRTPSRQSAIAGSLGATQQAVSHAAKSLQDLSVNAGDGLVATDRRQLLERWRSEYPGPGGTSFGWYSLATPTEQVESALDVAVRLDLSALVSGDVAADMIAPWKHPSRGLVYTSGPIDLAEDGFVPAPLSEATLVTCIPRDPTLWRLAASHESPAGTSDLPVADPVIVYGDLLMSSDQDSEEAAQQIALLITEDSP